MKGEILFVYGIQGFFNILYGVFAIVQTYTRAFAGYPDCFFRQVVHHVIYVLEMKPLARLVQKPQGHGNKNYYAANDQLVHGCLPAVIRCQVWPFGFFFFR